MTKLQLVSLAKAFTWRVLGSIGTFFISWYLTGSIKLSASISISEFVGKIILYYIHERLWAKITSS